MNHHQSSSFARQGNGYVHVSPPSCHNIFCFPVIDIGRASLRLKLFPFIWKCTTLGARPKMFCLPIFGTYKCTFLCLKTRPLLITNNGAEFGKTWRAIEQGRHKMTSTDTSFCLSVGLVQSCSKFNKYAPTCPTVLKIAWGAHLYASGIFSADKLLQPRAIYYS